MADKEDNRIQECVWPARGQAESCTHRDGTDRRGLSSSLPPRSAWLNLSQYPADPPSNRLRLAVLQLSSGTQHSPTALNAAESCSTTSFHSTSPTCSVSFVNTLHIITKIA